MTLDKKRPIAVLIDAENVSANYAQSVFMQVSRLGDATIRRFYCDISKPTIASWMEQQPLLGLTPVHQSQVANNKNAADMAMIVDAMDLMYSGRVTGFAIVSSDSDFTPLARRLREQGMQVFGFGEKKVPRSFRSYCSRFFELEELPTDVIRAPEPATVTAGVSDAQERVLSAMAISGTTEGWYSLGEVGSRLRQNDAEFRPGKYGYKKLSDLVRVMPLIEVRRGAGSQLLLRRAQRQLRTA